ncbi:hypothetical protein GIB67_038133 [Kingdonia uniflora]|uniref:F-box domain-containing protein n=1 Tax=Kingdonia uniflora TaxID=39325 RepID=A0A7J7M1W8_9MAGN|nr:hypothetical protein GIB67_038133 [Kingdonia uniflora]
MVRTSKVSKKNDNDVVDEEDRISNLPQLVIDHIISFLPMKDTMRTTILSRKWRDYLYFLPNLSFDDILDAHTFGEGGFDDFVDKTLRLRDKSNVNKLKLIITKTSTCGRLNTWISYAVAHNVQKLNVGFDFFEREEDREIVAQMRLPHCLFTSKSLVKLKLCMPDHILKFPSNIQFPVLKTLALSEITFFDNHLTTKLFSSCPLLQNLKIDSCDVSRLNVLFISIPTLEKLCYYGDIPQEFTLNKLPSLSELSLHFIRHGPTTPTRDYRATKVLKAINNASMLQFCSKYMESLSAISNLSTCLPTSCPKLKHIRLSIRPTEKHMRVMVSLMKTCPCLKFLDISFDHNTTVNALNREGYWDAKELSAVVCMLNNLEKVCIYTFEASEVELDMVRVIIGNAHVLKKMVLNTMKKMCMSNPEKCLQICEKMLTFPRPSSCATIDVVTR